MPSKIYPPNIYRYDQFSEAQLSTICRLRNLHVLCASWLAYSLALLAHDRKLGVEQAIIAHNRWAKRCAEQRLAMWRGSTVDGMPLLVAGEDERRRLVDSAITDGSFQLSPAIEQDLSLRAGIARRRGSAAF
jgi:hypothetical protein